MVKKYIFFLVCVVIVVSGCEKDDFCIDPITPNLILRFHDADNPTFTSSVMSLTVWPEGRDTIVNNQTLDSVAIPLNVTQEQTIYNLRMDTIVDQITINYTVNEIFVSRSCGFKATFSDVNFSSSNNWIDSIAPSTVTLIENESAAHIQIFH